MAQGSSDLTTLLARSQSPPMTGSFVALSVLAVAWCGAFAWLTQIAIDLIVSPMSPPAGIGLAAIIGAIVTMALRFQPFWWLLCLAPLILLTWLGLPRTDRRKLSILGIVWSCSTLAALTGVFGLSTRGHLVAVGIGSLISLEGTRLVLASMIRRRHSRIAHRVHIPSP
jgi:hypothetical protein